MKSQFYKKTQYDPNKIGGAPNVKSGKKNDAIGQVQNYLLRYGYLPKKIKLKKNKLDTETEKALKLFQKHCKIKETGELDPATRSKLIKKRCGMPEDNPLAASTTKAWNKRNLKYSFGRLTTDNVSPEDVMDAIKRAFNTWTNAGVGLTFQEVPPSGKPDIFIEWRSANDPDFNMVGGEIAHADYPPGASKIVNKPPLPIHFDDSENTWVIGAEFNSYDIETVALHEIGHCLGLKHSNVDGCVMNSFISSGFINRDLQPDDISGIESLYPSINA